jgi:hypothetical protein
MPEDLLTEEIPDLIRRAEDGDTNAARRLCALAGEWMSLGLDLGSILRPYIAQALKSVGAGEKPERAFNISRRGQPTKYSHFSKRLAVDLVLQCMEGGLSIDTSCIEASASLREYLEKPGQAAPSPYSEFHSLGVPDSEILKRWYYVLSSNRELNGD